MSTILTYLLIVFFASILTYNVYGWDKRCAQLGTRRVPENVLQMLALVGGWPGAYLAQQSFRHKTQKIEFLTVFWMMVVLHFGAVGFLVSQGALKWDLAIPQFQQEEQQVEPVITPKPRPKRK